MPSLWWLMIPWRKSFLGAFVSLRCFITWRTIDRSHLSTFGGTNLQKNIHKSLIQGTNYAATLTYLTAKGFNRAGKKRTARFFSRLG